MYEVELSANSYTKNMRETPTDIGVKVVKGFFKYQKLVSVPFDDRCDF